MVVLDFLRSRVFGGDGADGGGGAATRARRSAIRRSTARQSRRRSSLTTTRKTLQPTRPMRPRLPRTSSRPPSYRPPRSTHSHCDHRPPASASKLASRSRWWRRRPLFLKYFPRAIASDSPASDAPFRPLQLVLPAPNPLALAPCIGLWPCSPSRDERRSYLCASAQPRGRHCQASEGARPT